MTETREVLKQAQGYDFSQVKTWLLKHPGDVNTSVDRGDGRCWTVLHWVADAEAKGTNISGITEALLAAGANPHQGDREQGKSGDTPFNVAAPSSPKTGRLMTNHWLAMALEGKGSKKLNEKTGSHDSTLAQYIAKWSNDDEIENQLKQAREKGMDIAVQNSSGWTALHASAAMGRVYAVKVLLGLYDEAERNLRTTEEYMAPYGVNFSAGSTADKIAKMRLDQDKNLSPDLMDNLEQCIVLASIASTPNKTIKTG